MSQRVNIQYSIDLEAIPNEVKSMLQYSFMRLSELNDLCDKMSPDVNEKIDGENFHNVLAFIHEIRKSIADIDYRLNDCTGLVYGYQSYLTNQILPEEHQQTISQESQAPVPAPYADNTMMDEISIDQIEDKISQLRTIVETSEDNE